MTGTEPISKYYKDGKFIRGYSMTRLYKTWLHMKERCYSPKDKRYAHYGERGIVLCEKWKNDFLTFAEWAVNNGYEEHLTIDRIDVNKGYCPENCRWVTMIVQQNNRSNNRIVEMNGERHTLSEWTRILGLSIVSLNYRIKRGWSYEKISTTPMRVRKKKG